MPKSTTLTKETVIKELQKGFDEVITFTQPLAEATFFRQPDSKWSIAENVEHLILSVKPLALAFSLPKFGLRFFGTPNRDIRTYDEVVVKYEAKLNSGGRATPAFIPNTKRLDKKALLVSFTNENNKFINSLQKWNEADLDRYLLPHPLLGKLYLREMLYFTIHHTQHHLKAIKRIAQPLT